MRSTTPSPDVRAVRPVTSDPEAGQQQALQAGIRSPYVWLIAAPLLWSGNMVFGKVLAEAVPPITLSGVRWAVSAVLLAVAGWYSGGLSWPKKEAWGPIAAMAVTGVAIFTPLVYASLHAIGTVEAALIQSSTPVFALLLARLIAGEDPGWPQAGGALLTVLGVAAIVSHGELSRLVSWRWGEGDLLMLLAAFLWAAYTVAARQAAAHTSALSATFHAAWLGLLMLLPGTAWELLRGSGLHLTPAAWAGVAYVSVFPSAIAFLAWNYGVSRVGAGRASIFNNLLPLFTAVWAVFLLGEGLSWAEAIGGLLIAGGVSLGTLKPRSRRLISSASRVGGDSAGA